ITNHLVLIPWGLHVNDHDDHLHLDGVHVSKTWCEFGNSIAEALIWKTGGLEEWRFVSGRWR
nr:hypothetical protein [Tanacetum cinerariifolium]